MVYLKSVENVITLGKLIGLLLPARASEQGNWRVSEMLFSHV